MAITTKSITVFISCQVFNDSKYTSMLLGYKRNSSSQVLINCVTVIESFDQEDKNSRGYLQEIKKYKKDTLHSADPCIVGKILRTDKKKGRCFYPQLLEDAEFFFVLYINELAGSFDLDFVNTNSSSKFYSQIVLYNSSDLLRASLLFPCAIVSNEYENCDFLSFLLNTVKVHEKHSRTLLDSKTDISSMILCVMSFLFNTFTDWLKALPINSCSFCETKWSIHLTSGRRIENISFWGLSSCYTSFYCETIKEYIVVSQVGRQFHQRFMHLRALAIEFSSHNKLSLKGKNVSTAIILDLLCGWIIIFVLWRSKAPEVLLDVSMKIINDVVIGLQNIIYWLMGVPAGLKLNIPLNSALGQFFLYHIYLWKAYMMIVHPIFVSVLQISTIIGVFGVTFVLCILSDLVSLGTIHIYCFYGYAARLYGYQISSLMALWRLFRGKKWNPLRERVDSYTYNKQQLFLGTLIFTILLFLLPTVVMYYIVFTALRILVLVFQGVLSKFIIAISLCPVYAFFMRLFGSIETAGDIRYTVFDPQETLVLNMQIIQIPVFDVLKRTLPDYVLYDEYLNWKHFLSNLVKGTIIYPL